MCPVPVSRTSMYVLLFLTIIFLGAGGLCMYMAGAQGPFGGRDLQNIGVVCLIIGIPMICTLVQVAWDVNKHGL